MLVQLLSWAAAELPLWVCYGLVGILIAGLGAPWSGQGFTNSNHELAARRSVQAFKENLRWKTNPK